MLSVCAMSDLHGYLPEVEPCDLVLICGDIVPLEYQGSSNKTNKWFNKTFRDWTEQIDCKKILFIAGNHELRVENHTDKYRVLFPEHNKATYLKDSKYIYEGSDGKSYSIYGTPWCKVFGNWAFMATDDVLKQIFNEIPEGLDILITHDAPFGVSDILLQEGYYTGEHIGNKPLAEAILQKVPKIVCHGHLHSTSREFEELGYSKVVNCSIKDEHYNPIYDPIVFEL